MRTEKEGTSGFGFGEQSKAVLRALASSSESLLQVRRDALRP